MSPGKSETFHDDQVLLRDLTTLVPNKKYAPQVGAHAPQVGHKRLETNQIVFNALLCQFKISSTIKSLPTCQKTLILC